MPETSEAVSGVGEGGVRVAQVIEWFGAHARDLPWRRADCSAWGVLVSEVMLQQTPVARVLPVWHTWMTRWPTPAALAEATQADAVRAWERLGYPRRAKRLWECAGVIVERHGGEVPADAAELRALPGVGEYTASAVEAFAFGRRSIVLDTNVRRVLARAWMGVPLPGPSPSRAERALAAQVSPLEPAAAAAWAAASMELGALVCVARAPRCGDCPLRASCTWVAKGSLGLDQAPRRTQAWAGTDRQVRGRVLAVLRAADAPVVIAGRPVLEDVEPGQLDRCVASLVADGLIAQAGTGTGRFVLA